MEFNYEEFIRLNGVADLSLWDASVTDQPPEQPVQRPHTGSRSYRPRNPRSCDLCRTRKTACRIEDEPPCATCKSLGKECTFAERSRKRRRQDASYPAPPVSRAQEHYTILGDGRKSVSLHSDSSVEERAALPLLIATGPLAPMGPEAQPWRPGADDNDQVERPPPGLRNLTLDAFDIDNSLDLKPTSTGFLLGDTGESDPYLLRHSTLACHDEGTATKISYRRVFREGEAPNDPDLTLDNERPLIFMFARHSLHEKYEPRVEDDVLRNARLEVDRMCNDDVGVRLIKLYFKYVYPYFPILSRSQMLLSASGMRRLIQDLPLSLRAVLYAIGLPFMVYDDVLSTTLDLTAPSAQSLYRISWLAIAHEIHTPHLSTLQACLLLLQRVNDDRYVMDSPFRWSLLAWTVSLAQSLGLSTDCSTWQGIPAWERRLRRRLWWATYVIDKWSFMSAGLCSHIKKDDFDVLPLSSADFITEAENPHPNEAIQDDDTLHESSHFYHLVELSMILSDILDSYYSIRALKVTASNFTLSLELAKGIRSRLRAWKESFDVFISLQQNNPRQQTTLDGNASLGLAYPVATMILFRALLRPLESSTGSREEQLMREDGREAVRVGAKACCVEVVQYLEQVQVKRGVWDAFWHSWSRAGFAIASSFMMRLLITSTSTAETEELNNLITRWRWAMRTGGGNAGNVLMSLGLLRLDRSLLKSGILISQEDMLR